MISADAIISITLRFSKGSGPTEFRGAIPNSETPRELFFLVQSVNEAALVKFGDEIPVDKLFNLGGFYSRLRYRDFFEHAAHAFRAGIGLGRSDARIIIVSFLGDSVVADAEKLLDHLNTFHFVRPVKSDSFDKGA